VGVQAEQQIRQRTAVLINCLSQKIYHWLVSATYAQQAGVTRYNWGALNNCLWAFGSWQDVFKGIVGNLPQNASHFGRVNGWALPVVCGLWVAIKK